MRVLLVTTWYPTALAPGSGVFVRKDAELLATRHDVHVIHLAAPDLLSEADDRTEHGTVRVTRIPMRTSRPGDWLRAGRQLSLHLSHADVLHTQAFSTLLALIGRRVSRPWVHTEHWSALSNPETVAASARPLLALFTRLLRRPDVVTAVCEYLAAPVRRVRRGTTSIVPCIVPPASTVVPPPGVPGAPTLVAVGGLLDRKDPLCAVEALALVRRSHPDAVLRWVGDGPLREQVHARAAELGMSGAVTVTGVRDMAGVIDELQRGDVFLLPTKGENFCVSAAEAIVNGRIAVVGANGGQAEYIDDRNGRLVHEQVPHAYAQAVLEVLGRPQLPAADIAATIGDRFAPAQVMRGYEAAYAAASRARGSIIP
ncbi:glycosyltransferase [Microbacterium sp. M28]|uniref:glycosyltransferase n=1 Tax=Microbacterium sp. M28 TaxID=2962064 RepID=UPI0021F41604|nr:glycosyltransferase [Microbacterium sp. M28]UYO98170.1 glycosyltransferase [Microbacterium sp. M28]